MTRVVLLGPLLFSTTVGLLAAQQAAADPPDILRNYRFIPSRSTVHVSGGFAGFDMDLSARGKFGLVTGYDYGITPTQVPTLVPHAEFVDVNAIFFNPKSLAPVPVPGWDLDDTLNLSGLNGTFRDPRVLNFRGLDGQGMPIKLQAVLRGPLIRITGENDPSCCDFFHYKIDMLAHRAPYADFNLDGTINRGDLETLLGHIGMTGAAFEDGDADADGDVDGGDFLTWQRMYGAATSMSEFADTGPTTGAVPEPSTAMLLTCVALTGICRRRARR
jgi:hypothetical protein